MRSGRSDWTCKCPRSTLSRVHEAADAGREAARVVYVRLNLPCFVRWDAFRKWFGARRRAAEQRRREAGLGARDSGLGTAGRMPTPPAETAAGRMPALPTTDPDSPASSASSAFSAVASGQLPLTELIEAMRDSIARGDAKLYEIAAGMKALAVLTELQFRANVDRRAGDKHAAWKAEYAAKQDAALEQVSTAAQLTPEQVAEIRLKVLGL